MSVIKDKDLLLNVANAYLLEEPRKDYRTQIENLLKDMEHKDAFAAAELSDRLLGQFTFGTAGLRGKMQGGYRRMNEVTVARAAWALGKYLLQKNNNSSVVIGFDARINSLHFAELSAQILRAMGIKVFWFSDFIPTSLLSFAVIKLRTSAGIMVTASHNPPQDNGYKIYWNNGAQLIEPHNDSIAELMTNAPVFAEIPKFSLSDQKAQALNQNVLAEITESYFSDIRQYQLSTPNKSSANIKIVYTALHGVGGKYVLRALREGGFSNVEVVKNQQTPDGSFPTVSFPNPEEKGTLDETIATTQRYNAELALANDPDADRLAVLVRNKTNQDLVSLSGNQIGVLFGDYALRHAQNNKTKPLVVTTLVSTRMLARLAKHYGASYLEAFTGFSRIANASMNEEAKNNTTFVFAFEEALGYCLGDFVRDKDGVCAAVRFAQLFAQLKEANKDPLTALDDLAIKHGNYQSLQWSRVFAGPHANNSMSKIMTFFRNNTGSFKQLCGEKFAKKRDFKNEPGHHDVLMYFTSVDTRLVIRPSGTEPKIKFYLETVDYVNDKAQLLASRIKFSVKLDEMRDQLLSQIRSLETELT